MCGHLESFYLTLMCLIFSVTKMMLMIKRTKQENVKGEKRGQVVNNQWSVIEQNYPPVAVRNN